MINNSRVYYPLTNKIDTINKEPLITKLREYALLYDIENCRKLFKEIFEERFIELAFINMIHIIKKYKKNILLKLDLLELILKGHLNEGSVFCFALIKVELKK